MPEQKKHIDDFFRERMEAHSEAPPPFVWKSLEQKLDSTATPASVVSYYKWLRYGVVLCVLSVLVFLGYRKFADTGDVKHSNAERVAMNGSGNNTGIAAGNAVAGNYSANTAHTAAIEQAGSNSEHNDGAGAESGNRQAAATPLPGEQANNNLEASLNNKNTSTNSTQNKGYTSTNTGAKKKEDDNTLASSMKGGNMHAYAAKAVKDNYKYHSDEQWTNKGANTGNHLSQNDAAHVAGEAHDNISEGNDVAATDHKATGKKAEEGTGKNVYAAKTAKVADADNAPIIAGSQKKGNSIADSKNMEKPAAGDAGNAKQNLDKAVAQADKNKKGNNAAAKMENKPVVSSGKEVGNANKAVMGREQQDEISAAKEGGAEVNALAAQQADNRRQQATGNKEPEQVINAATKNNTTGAAAQNIAATSAGNNSPLPNAARSQVSGSSVPPVANNKVVLNAQAGNSGNTVKQKPLSTTDFLNNLTTQDKPKKKIYRTSVEEGIMLGYEIGFNRFAANKYVIAPYVQYNIGKFGISLQPAIKIARNAHTSNLGSTETYYNVTSDPYYTTISDTIYTADSLRVRMYAYSETHDSISIGHHIETKSYAEIELPLLLKYKPAKNLSVYGGMLINYSNTVIRIKEDRQVNSTTGSYIYSDSFNANTPAPDIPEASSVFHYPGIAYIKYSNADYQDASSMKVRAGYMLGASYTIHDKFLIDVSVQQNLSNMSYVPNKDVRGIYTQPYVRLSAGYRLFNNNKNDKKHRKH